MHGLVETWDGVPLDTTVTLPSSGARGLPLVAELHGFGNSKYEYLDPASTAYTDNAFAWARDGYAVLTFTARGLWGSCGTPESRLASPAACATATSISPTSATRSATPSDLIGRLVDDGTADPRRIGVTGDSYGGGQSLALAALSRPDDAPRRHARPVAQPGGDAAAPRRGGAGDPVERPGHGRRAQRPRLADRRHRPAAARPFRSGSRRPPFVNAIFAAAQFATGPASRSGEPFVPGRPMGFLAPPDRSRRRTSPAGSRAPDAASPTRTSGPSRSSTSSPATTRAYLHRPRPPAAAPVPRLAASPTTSSRSTRCCGSPTAPTRLYPGVPVRCCSATSGISAPRTSRPTERPDERHPRLVRPLRPR